MVLSMKLVDGTDGIVDADEMLLLQLLVITV